MRLSNPHTMQSTNQEGRGRFFQSAKLTIRATAIIKMLAATFESSIASSSSALRTCLSLQFDLYTYLLSFLYYKIAQT